MTVAYVMVVVAEEYLNGGYQQIADDLQAIPEVKLVERVSGTCDLVVKVEVPPTIRIASAADKLLAKNWVKHLQVLNVEPLGTSAERKAP